MLSINRKENSGFTLIEMMIVVAIVAILAAISIPAYQNYILKSEMRTAQSELLALSLQFENRYQRMLAYPSLPYADVAALTADTAFPGWRPSSTKFGFSSTTTDGYTLTATGSGNHTGCTLTLNKLNVRAASGCKFGGNNWL